jgi:hypothetical protein
MAIDSHCTNTYPRFRNGTAGALLNEPLPDLTQICGKTSETSDRSAGNALRTITPLCIAKINGSRANHFLSDTSFDTVSPALVQ